MADVVLSAFLQAVFEKLASGVLARARKIWGSDFRRELRKLESTLLAVQAVLQDAEERQLKDKTLRDWLAKLKDAAYEVDDILEEFNLAALRHEREIRGHVMKKVRNFLPSFNSLSFRNKMGRKIREIVERLEGIAEERFKFHLRTESGKGRQLGERDRPQTHSFVVESEVVGRDEDKRKIVESLIGHDGRNGVPILSIVGIGGVGKTTLAQLVYNEKRVAEHFQQRIWVCVADNFDTQKLVMAIIETATGEKWESSTLILMDLLQRRLREILSAKKFLLVLDDIWNENPQRWEELKVLLTSSAEGSAIIVTTRSENVSSIVSTVDAYGLSSLSEDDCWILFKQSAFVAGVEEPPNLVNIGKIIVKKCGGLPLAAKTLGSLLRHKREEWEWRLVMESEIWELPNDGILPSLRLSYNQLPFLVKQCFAYCAIFPKDYEIDREMLIQLWIANEFLPIDSTMEPELKGRQIFYELASGSFFQDFKEVWDLKEGYMKRTCRMHDLIHNLAQSLMANECCILDKPRSSIPNGKIRHLSVMNDDADLSGILHTCKSMRTLLVFTRQGYRAKLSHINQSESYLRVLSLRGNAMTEIPISLYHMKHLRYLDLSYTNIITLPEATCGLLYLQTLKLTGCRYLCKLPSDMRNMSSLRHLYLYGCYDLHCMPKGIGQLRHLRTLTAYAVGNKIASGGIGELKDLDIEGMLHLYGLRNVRNASDAEVANLGSKHNLQCLNLDWRDSENEQIMTMGNAEEVLGALQLPQSLKTCTIHSYTGTRFQLNSQQLGQIPFLEVLQIKNLVYVKHLGGSEFYGNVGDQVSTVFPALRKLELHGMDNLEEWSGVEGRPSFPHLLHLSIYRCPKLTNVPSLQSVKDLVLQDCPLLLPAKGFFEHMLSLNRLQLSQCEKLTLLLEQDEDESGTCLQELTIVGCNQLMLSSPSLGLWKNFSSLQYLHIERCDGLNSLPVEMIQGLSSLKRLYIDGCQNLTGSSSFSATSGVAGGLQLQSLTVLEEVEIRYCEKLDNFALDSLQQLTALKRLALVGCGRMTALPEFPESLLDVRIDGCHNISSLPERLGCLTTLASLKIYTLPNLSSLPEGMEGLQALEDLTVWDCPNLLSFPIGLQQRLPSLRYLRINFCAGLQSKFEDGGEYWPLISCIPKKEIG